MRKTSVKDHTLCAMMAAVLCLLCPIAVPVGAVPVSLTNFVIFLMLYLLGIRKTLTAYIVYWVLGAVGMPVFSGFQGGVGKLFGPTGGFLLGFAWMIPVAGKIMECGSRKPLPAAVGMVLGMLIDYALGTVWFSFQTSTHFGQALAICVLPFLAVDVLKIVAALSLGSALRPVLLRAGICCFEN